MRDVKIIGLTILMVFLVYALAWAAGEGLSTWTELAEVPASGDWMALTDVSDTTGSTDGTSKKVLYKNAAKLVIVNKSSGTTLTDDEMGGMVFVSAAVTTTLPAVEIGQTVCFYSTAANTIIVDVNASDGIVLNGASRLTDGNVIENTSAAAGDFVCLVGDSADGWTTLGYIGTWADGGGT